MFARLVSSLSPQSGDKAPPEAKNLVLKKLAVEMCQYGLKETRMSFVGTPLGVSWLLGFIHATTDDDSLHQIEAVVDPKNRYPEKKELFAPALWLLHRLKVERKKRQDEFKVVIEAQLLHPKSIHLNADFKKHIAPKYLMKIKTHSDLATITAIVKGEFKDSWVDVFRQERTEIGDFHGSAGTRKEHLMHRCRDFDPYYEDYTMQAACLRGKSVHMWIVLPKEKFKLQDFVRSLDESVLAKLFDCQKYEQLDFILPRFHSRQPIETAKFLQYRGLIAPFTGGQNRFPRMAQTDQISIGRINDEVEVQVNEEGCQARFRHEMDLPTCTSPMEAFRQKPIPFHATRPFLYFICLDKEPIFCGGFI